MRFQANQGGTAKITPFRPYRSADRCRAWEERGFYVYNKQAMKRKKCQGLLCPESEGNAETFALTPSMNVISELLIENRIKRLIQ
ncbi:hypothetical protein BCV73_04670 [Paenibacillus sp. SSG-1]|nr:hypothetical protein BCV73_04670 [Paenibacillus sp. SSG-1]